MLRFSTFFLVAIILTMISGCIPVKYNVVLPGSYDEQPYTTIRYDGYYTNSVSPIAPDSCIIFYPDGRAWFFDKASIFAISNDSIALRCKNNPDYSRYYLKKNLLTIESDSTICWNVDYIPYRLRLMHFVPAKVSPPPAWDKCPKPKWKYKEE